jgi:hypothetical protein
VLLHQPILQLRRQHNFSVDVLVLVLLLRFMFGPEGR